MKYKSSFNIFANRPHNYFITPNIVIERHRRDLRRRSHPNKNTNCHYHGKVRGEDDSNVAISTCVGMVSLKSIRRF